MIKGANGNLTIYVGSKKVKAGDLGTIKVYPNSFLEVTQALTFIAAGETKQLSINCVEGQTWSLIVPTGFTANISSGSGPATINITAANNTTTSAKSGTITVNSVDGLSATCSLSQAAGSMATEYTSWVTNSIDLTSSTTSIGAVGGSATLTVKASQTRYKITKWNGIETNRTTESQTPDVSTSSTYAKVSGDGSITSRTVTFGNNVSTSSKSGVYKATYSGKTDNITITQAAGTRQYGNITISTFSYPTVRARGGTVNPTLAYSQIWTWNGVSGSGGTITAGAALSYSGTSINTSNGAATIGSKGTTVSGVTTATTATVNVTLNGKSASKTTNVQQEANEVTSYDMPTGRTLSVGAIPASGGTISSGTLGGTITQSRTFTSGSTDTLTNPTVSASSYSSPVSASSKGTTISGVTTVGTLTYYYTCNGKQGSVGATVTQAANAITGYDYGNWSVSLGNSGTSIPASGGTITFNPIASRSKSPVYTSGSIGSSTNETATATVETVTSASLISISQTSATAANRYQTAGNAQTAVVKATYSGVSSANISITLAANNPTVNTTCDGTTLITTYSNWPSGAPNNSVPSENNYDCGYRVSKQVSVSVMQSGVMQSPVFKTAKVYATYNSSPTHISDSVANFNNPSFGENVVTLTLTKDDTYRSYYNPITQVLIQWEMTYTDSGGTGATPDYTWTNAVTSSGSLAIYNATGAGSVQAELSVSASTRSISTNSIEENATELLNTIKTNNIKVDDNIKSQLLKLSKGEELKNKQYTMDVANIVINNTDIEK